MAMNNTVGTSLNQRKARSLAGLWSETTAVRSRLLVPHSKLYDRPFPEGVQTSENLYARGIIDAVLPPEEIGEILDRALSILMAAREGVAPVAEG